MDTEKIVHQFFTIFQLLGGVGKPKSQYDPTKAFASANFYCKPSEELVLNIKNLFKIFRISYGKKNLNKTFYFFCAVVVTQDTVLDIIHVKNKFNIVSKITLQNGAWMPYIVLFEVNELEERMSRRVRDLILQESEFNEGLHTQLAYSFDGQIERQILGMN